MVEGAMGRHEIIEALAVVAVVEDRVMPTAPARDLRRHEF
jgi:hypothetical protein